MIRFFAIALFATASVPTMAATYCAADSDGLKTALQSAAANNEDNTIHLSVGTFTPFTAGGFTYISNNPHALTLSGGYDTYLGVPCGVRAKSGAPSIIDGGGNDLLFRFLPLSGYGDLHLEGLEFRHGYGQGNDAPVDIGSGDYVGNITLERIVVRDNIAPVPAIFAGTKGSILVRNSVFVDNTIIAGYDNQTAIYFSSADSNGMVGGLTFTGNTVAGNLSLIAGGAARTSLYVKDGPLVVANSIFWNNAGVDLVVETDGEANVEVSYSDIGVVHFFGSHTTDHLYDIDPQFVGGGDYRLSASSPLVDAGNAAVTGGTGSYDAAGRTRVIGQVDVGAYEVDEIIFRNGFE